ncbi:hypothetical protein HPB47_017876, partial [Ixodes persulcatus]
GIRFIQEVVKRVRPTQNEYSSIIKALLPALFENLLNTSTDTKLCRELVTQILRDSKDKLGAGEHESLVEALSSFVGRNLAWSTSGVFRLLHDVATLHPRLVADTMSKVTVAAQDRSEARTEAELDATVCYHGGLPPFGLVFECYHVFSDSASTCPTIDIKEFHLPYLQSKLPTRSRSFRRNTFRDQLSGHTFHRH